MTKKFDAILVCGTGIKQTGDMVDSAISNVKKAVELYNLGVSEKIIFSGKWAWSLPVNPPITEAEAMKNLAINLGVPGKNILTETDSITSATNYCLTKKNILIPLNLKSLLIIISSRVLLPRAKLNAEMVLGPDYLIEFEVSDHLYQPEKLKELEESETQKMPGALNFFKDIIPGDDYTIYHQGMSRIKEKLKNINL